MYCVEIQRKKGILNLKGDTVCSTEGGTHDSVPTLPPSAQVVRCGPIWI